MKFLLSCAGAPLPWSTVCFSHEQRWDQVWHQLTVPEHEEHEAVMEDGEWVRRPVCHGIPQGIAWACTMETGQTRRFQHEKQ